MKKVNYDFGWGYEHYEGRTLSERMSLFSCTACGFALCALMRPIYAFLLTAQARYAIIFPDYRRERRVSKLMCEELYKTSVISIDSYENRVLTGRICNPFLEEDVFFHSTMEFLKEMEALLQDLSFPQSYAENRTFRPSPERTPRVAALVAPAPKKGRLATFSLQIKFRQNASWQGSLSWTNERREESFRSVLELLLLIDSALDRIVV